MAQIKITQVKSVINVPAYQRRVLIALGIRKTYNSVVKEDKPSVRGMIARVQQLVKVETVNN